MRKGRGFKGLGMFLVIVLLMAVAGHALSWAENPASADVSSQIGVESR